MVKAKPILFNKLRQTITMRGRAAGPSGNVEQCIVSIRDGKLADGAIELNILPVPGGSVKPQRAMLARGTVRKLIAHLQHLLEE